MTGRLVLVATPIGNLGDLSPRAVETLRTADLICCEDTRRTGKLLHLAGVSGVRMVVTNEHTEHDRIAEVLAALDAGRTVAVVSDAGMPGISDPGERLVAAAARAGHEVSAVPGPSAVVMAAVVSGLPSGRFVYEGFLPRSGRERTERIAAVATEPRTTVLYEAPHRLTRTLRDLVAACGPDRPLAICREMTKLHEEVWRGSLGEALERAETAEPIGEHVLVLGGAPAAPPATADDVDASLQQAFAAGLSTRDAAAQVSVALGLPRRTVYETAVRLAAERRPR